jgi:hypothetical protein
MLVVTCHFDMRWSGLVALLSQAVCQVLRLPPGPATSAVTVTSGTRVWLPAAARVRPFLLHGLPALLTHDVPRL